MPGRGFAAMDRERVSEIARMGGKSNTRRHQWTTDEAREAGRKGGLAAAERRRAERAAREASTTSEAR